MRLSQTLEAAGGSPKLLAGMKTGSFFQGFILRGFMKLVPTKARLFESFDGIFGSTNHLCDPAVRNHDS